MFDDEKVANFMRCLFKNYDQCKGKSVRSIPNFLFWDVIVLTTGDAEQQKVFELQLDAKRSRGDLPLDVPFHVFSDPPNVKTGNGGATINSLAHLQSIYKHQLSSMRILLIHAGGQSQRLPSASVMGKIFTAIPVGKSFSDMLDLNLALFLTFLKKMQPGVFVTCSDVILPYYLGVDGDWSFELPGFTVLAHPSLIKIGTKHGVYVLKDAEAALQKNVGLYQCLKVLQKPHENAMRDSGAVVTRNNKEFVYTDSVFFFDHEITTKFLKFHADFGPICCEIDGYGDFLQALGQLATSDYIHNMSNVSDIKPELLNMRLKVFDLLKCLPLNTIVLNDSKFYHLGTMQEYITNFCEDALLGKVMNFKRMSFNKILQNKPKSPSKSLGSILHSILTIDSSIPENSVIEYCNFDVPVKVGQNSVISNCEYISIIPGETTVKKDIRCLDVPSNAFLHSVPVKHESKTRYITIMCSTSEDLKVSAHKDDAETLQYFGHNLSKVIKILGKSVDDVFIETETCNLWRAKLFPAMPTMSEAFVTSVAILQQILGVTHGDFNITVPDNAVWLSMADMMKTKDVSIMLDYRNCLHDTINASL